MRKFLLVLIFTCYLTTVLLLPADVFECKVYPANNRVYHKMVLPLLKGAKDTIYIIMFLASYYPGYPDSPTNLFFKEIIEAKKRGVKVEVILNQSDSEYSSHATVENLKIARYLTSHNIPVYFSPFGVTTHSKMLIIDSNFTIIGSANWTYSAMVRNNETSVIIESPELARYYMEYFREIRNECFLFLQPPEKIRSRGN